MIVITNPVSLKKEVDTINALFANGLDILHIRKPDSLPDEIRYLIENINDEYHPKLALHQHHEMASDYYINRLHFNEKARQGFNEGCKLSAKKQWIFSTSVHSVESFNELNHAFNYAFLSPVYDSISKPGYMAGFENKDTLKGRNNFAAKLIGLGGINSANCIKTIDVGFDSVAFLGAIWQSENPISEFKKCLEAINNYVQ